MYDHGAQLFSIEYSIQILMLHYLSYFPVDEMMISLLDSGSHEIVYTACGVLINMMVDCEKRSILKDEGGIKKYVNY